MDESAAVGMSSRGNVSAALLRFWWVVLAGVIVGLLLALWMVYELPGFTARDQPVYTAASRISVTSSQGQYIRISVPRLVETGGSAGESRGGGGGNGGTGGTGGGGPIVVNEPPDVQPLLNAANYYPNVIESDQVAALREKMFGPLEGTVQANAYSAVSTPQRYVPAQIPVIDIFATAGTPDQAVTLADSTTAAFTRFIKIQQNRAGIAPEERILFEELQQPRTAFATGGPSYGIPILVALAVMAAFGLLAVVLDQLFPLPVRVPQPQSGTS